MSEHGHRSGGRAARGRAVVAVLTLYGLVLQAFLTGLGPAPVAAGIGILCQEHPGSPGRDGLVHPHACCPLACSGSVAPPAPAAGQAWPRRAALGPVWRVAATAALRSPAAGPASARGPPAA
ncbi:hypothetical protein FF100_23185 [Methylobacterium terricola]|uniref:DUF2946 domain-containing protein n=1 Tax=Methylobacterium terricola TaxID=2583531 RepID=A0A5C4LB39_9HYPH|nr:hypothetical protein [Methylobacterium terricola]TNC10194.1 hypothetical protein FF100_23185 [Methylobacterium terricola]